MPKPQTKADQILNEARQRVLAAKNQVIVAEGVLSQAAAALRAHEDAYAALEKALTPKPRKKKDAAQPELIQEKQIAAVKG